MDDGHSGFFQQRKVEVAVAHTCFLTVHAQKCSTEAKCTCSSMGSLVNPSYAIHGTVIC